MPKLCSRCGNPVGEDARFCPSCGQNLGREMAAGAGVTGMPAAETPEAPPPPGSPPAPGVPLAPEPAVAAAPPPPPPDSKGSRLPWAAWSPKQRRRYGLLALGGIAVILIIVLVVALSRDGGNAVTATHESGVEIVAEVESGGAVSVSAVQVPDSELPQQLAADGAWRFDFSGELSGVAAVTIPEPDQTNYGVMVELNGRWQPISFTRTGSGDIHVEIGADQIDAAAFGAAASVALAGGESPMSAARTDGGDLFEWGFRLAIVLFDSVEAAADYALDQAGGLYGEWSGYIADYASPAMCSQPLAGVQFDDDANAKALLQVCVEDGPAGPVVLVANNTRFALEVFATGADVRHEGGGADVAALGGRGVVVNGGDTTKWTSGGLSVTFTAEFTEYAFLRQLSVWIVDLIPAGSEVMQRGEDLSDAISLLQDALKAGSGLDAAIDHLSAGDYGAAFRDVVDLLTQEAVIEQLVENGCIERLVGFRLDEEMLGEVFDVLQLAGSVADLGSLLYTTWQTGGYVRGEVTVHLPETNASGDQSTAVQQTTTTSRPFVEITHLGSITAAEAPHTFTFELPDSYDRVLCTTYDPDDPDSSAKYGGWQAWMEVNGSRVFEWVEYDGTDSLYKDYLSGETVYGSTGVGDWFDITGLVDPGSNEIVFYHYNEGPGVGIKISVEGGGAQTGSTIPGNLGTGDVQVTLLWDSVADLDLHVIDPFGEEVWFGEALSSSGGELDVDMHGNCEGSSNPVENVFWPPGEAPRGSYRAGAMFYSTCEGGGTVSFEIVVHLDGVEQPRFEGAVEIGQSVFFDFSY